MATATVLMQRVPPAVQPRGLNGRASALRRFPQRTQMTGPGPHSAFRLPLPRPLGTGPQPNSDRSDGVSRLQEVPQVTVKVLEHGNGSIRLFPWLTNERDALGLVRTIVPPEIVSEEK